MLAEMIKVGDIGIDILVDFIRDNNATEADWQSMLLPTGKRRHHSLSPP